VAGKHCSTSPRQDILLSGRGPRLSSPDLLTQIFGFLSTTARYVGEGVVGLIQYIFPEVKSLSTLAEPIGFLSLLTIFVILTSAARKVALIILAVGWLLILVRLLLMAFAIG
jgi:hypothetical protein